MSIGGVNPSNRDMGQFRAGLALDTHQIRRLQQQLDAFKAPDAESRGGETIFEQVNETLQTAKKKIALSAQETELFAKVMENVRKLEESMDELKKDLPEVEKVLKK